MLLYTGAMTQDLTVDQHSAQNTSVLNQLHRGYSGTAKPSTKDATYNALHCPCLVSENFLYISTNVSSLQS